MQPLITTAIPDLAGPTALSTMLAALPRHTLEPREVMLFVEAGSKQTIGSGNSLDTSNRKEPPGSNFPSKHLEKSAHTTIVSQPTPAAISTSDLPLVSHCTVPKDLYWWQAEHCL